MSALWLVPAIPVVLLALVLWVHHRRVQASAAYHERIAAVLDQHLPREEAAELWQRNRQDMRS